MKRLSLRRSRAILIAGLLAACAPVVRAQVDAATVLSNKAQVELDGGKFEDAAKSLQQLLKDYPTSPKAMTARANLGFALFMTRNYAGAVDALKQVVNDKTLPPALKEFAAIYLAQAKSGAAGQKVGDAKRQAYEDAAKEYTTFLETYAQSTSREQALYGRALCQYFAQKYDEAAADLELAARTYTASSSRPDTLFLLGAVYAAKAQQLLSQDKDTEAAPVVQKARGVFEQVIKGPDRPTLFNEAYYNLGEILYSAGKHEEAMAHFRKMRSKAETEAALKRRIDALQGQLAGADARSKSDILRQKSTAEDQLAGLKDAPDQQFDALSKIAVCLVQLKQFDEGRTVANHVLKFATPPQKRFPAYVRALSFLLQGRVEEGQREADAFFAAYPKDSLGDSFGVLLGSLYLETGKPELAIAQLERQMRDYPNSKLKDMAFMTLLSAKGKAGRGGSVEDELRKFIESAPTPQQKDAAKRNLAKILDQNKKYDDAVVVYRDLAATAQDPAVKLEAGFQVPAVLERAKKFADAAKEYEAFGTANSGKAELAAPALFKAAQNYDLAAKGDQAQVLYQRIVQVFPKENVAPYAQQAIARALLSARPPKIDEAMAAFDELIKLFPQSDLAPAARFYQASIFAQRGKADDAIARYEAVQAEFPSSGVAADAQRQILRLRLNQLTAMGNYAAFDEGEKKTWAGLADGVLSGLGTFLEKYPDAPVMSDALSDGVKVWLAKIKNGVSKPVDAEQWFAGYEGRSASNPNLLARLQFARAAVPFTRGDMARAASIMKQAFQSNPSAKFSSDDYERLGTALNETKDFIAAQGVFEKLAAEFPKDPYAQANAIYGIGVAQAGQGKAAEADAAFARLEKDYGWSEKLQAARLKQATLKENTAPADALEIAKKIIEARTQTPIPDIKTQAMLLASRVQEKRGEIANAASYLEMIDTFVADSAPDDASPKGLFRAGEMFESTGKHDDHALRCYESLIMTYPNFEKVPQAKEKVKELKAKLAAAAKK